ncbi:MAG: 2-amino-4-hydroxy-6-hydroxymethyldihydropteridine diphosphokinase [Sedimenticola sp.]|nr:2-amino-4-hydroxy-6-hydroxymethyldihydropteridine diphosphokinase [Sedimenticola sp.]
MQHPAIAYIGLGSNLSDPVRQVRQALETLSTLPEVTLLKKSGLYRSSPMGPVGQPDYVNGVVQLETRLAPFPLLDLLQAIEQQQGRVRNERWGPRTLDLDLLLYGDLKMEGERLTIPHPGMAQRAFVLYPLQEIAPDLVIPGLGALATLVGQCPKQGLRPYE